MLIRLSVSNYAIIDRLKVDFDAGLNTVTGETGAGKSILMGALGLILGNRADMSVLKDKEKKCIVEGLFGITNYNLKAFFKENNVDYEAVTILRREITPSGKSRAFINDTPVNLKTMLELGRRLIDIHSQHQNLELSNHKFQLGMIDTVSGAEELLESYRDSYHEHRRIKEKLEELRQKSEKSNADLDYFQFQFNQLEEAGLEKGEQEVLEEELEVLVHAEEIKTALTHIINLLYNEQFSVIKNVKDSQKHLEKISDYVVSAPGLAERLQSAWLEINDILNEIESQSEKVVYNPERIEWINGRLDLIYSLQQKHHVDTVDELLVLKNSFEEQILKVESFGDEIKRLEKMCDEALAHMAETAAVLSKTRKKVFAAIEEAILADLKQLGMEKSKFEIQHTELQEFSPDGKDVVSFLFTANSDVPPAEISKIASGGEMSRLMLAIKNLLRRSSALPTVIFDEIDAGVSGEIAIKMGAIIESFAKTTQIINITHLPQIAARGKSHFVVYKLEEQGKTTTTIKKLSKAEREKELAKMVGGDNVTETTLKTAKELLKR
ncbi:MAG: DNA repair protein RecN [Draconibacterium sp.]|nr:MAG: DNA repair protein RecN [Draconibacterium sp.]PIF05216.1 MAG: DNA repair protein RecN [Draconibacterium sp.]